jgi:hypothetical protein
MNNQEMQFADPEWRPPQQGNVNTDPREQEPYIPQPINTEPREQPGWQTPPPQQERVYTGPPSYPEPQAEKIGVGQYAQRPRRRRSPWLWLIVVLIAFALIGRIATPFYGPHPRLHSEQALKPVSFLVSVHPTIVINNPTGTIDVHAGSADTVTINPTQKDGFGNPPQINYDQSQDSNTITVTVEDASVNFDVTVPSNADLQLETTDGGIHVTGVSGQMSLSSTVGNINATQDSLSGQSTLSNTDGNINASQDSLSGQSTLSTNGGNINASQDSLNGQSTLSTTTGIITFNGSINPNGTYQFSSTTGTIEITLPGNSSFHVDAATTTGSISSVFPEVNIQQPNGSGGADAHGDVGSPPRATVTLENNGGSISLNKQ